MLNNIRRILFRDKRGIALASVMIIFIVAVILVTGISTAIAAQANIIKSRESVSQAHYYAYSAVESVVAAMSINEISLKATGGVSEVVVKNILPDDKDIKAYIEKEKPSIPSDKRYKLKAEVPENGGIVYSEVIFDLKEIPTGSGSYKWKTPLSFVNISEGTENNYNAITKNGIEINDEEPLKSIDGLLNSPYKLSSADAMPDFKLKEGYIDSIPPGNKKMPANPNQGESVNNKLLIYNTHDTISFNSSSTRIIDSFIYAPDAKDIIIGASNITISNSIIYAPNAKITFSSNRFVDINNNDAPLSGFIYANEIEMTGFRNTIVVDGLLYAKEKFSITDMNSNNKDISFIGAVMAEDIYLSIKNQIPIVFKDFTGTKSIDDYLKGAFTYKSGVVIIDDGTESKVYKFDPTSIVYKK